MKSIATKRSSALLADAVQDVIRRPAISFRRAMETLEVRQMFELGGDGPDPSEIEDDSYEPNDSAAAATYLPLGDNQLSDNLTINGFSTQRDVDYFRVTAPPSGLLKFDIGYDSSGAALSLTIYNSAQQSVATGSARGTAGKTATIAATPGQTYFAKVSGGNNGSYWIEAHEVTASFNWSMPARFGGTGLTDQYGLPIIDNTPEYARPNPTTLGGKSVSRFPVRFSSTNVAGASYSWHVVGNASEGNDASYGLDFTGSNATVDLPNGTYTATLTVNAGGNVLTSTQSLTVRNYLLVAVGDSYSSGEGNPHADQTYDVFGFTTSGAKWAQGGNDYQTLMSRRAHRSSKAAVAQAALAIENADPKTSVTFIFLSQSGATIDAGMLGTKPSAEEGAPGTLPSQMDLLRDTVGSRHIDALTMSIGGNDIGFGDIFGGLVDADAVYDPVTYLDDLEEVFTTAENRIAQLGAKYQQLNSRLQQFDIGQVFLTEYPDLTKDGNGHYADYLGDIAPFMEADAGELKKAVDRLMVPFVTTMRMAARNLGWSFISGISDVFANGGYGGYGQIIRSAQQSIYQQGPLGWTGNTNNPLVVKETKGMMHPFGAGLDIQKNAILAAWRKPELVVENVSVPADAMLANATGQYSYRVRNASFLATSAASSSGLFASPNANVTAAGYKLIENAVPALLPGQSASFSGSIPNVSDPFRDGNNSIYLGVVADLYNNVGEANEVNNNPVSPVRLTSDNDVRVANGGLFLNLPQLVLGGTTYGAIGFDEVIGGFDVDSFRFTAYSGQRLQFNVNSTDGLDTYIKLFRLAGDGYYYDYWSGTGPFITGNDDGAAPGESASTQSFIDWRFLADGDYAIQISHKVNGLLPVDQLTFNGRQHGQYGHYSIVTTQVAADTTPPTVLDKGYDLDTHRAWFRVSEDITGAPALAALSMIDRTHGNSAVNAPATAVTYDAATKTIWFNLKGGLADGDFRMTLAKDAFADAAGNKLAATVTSDFFVLGGDANHDRKVDFNDLVILAQNYNKSGKAFSQGNFNRSGDGRVDFNDLVVIAQQYGKQMAAAPSTIIVDTKSKADFGRARIAAGLI